MPFSRLTSLFGVLLALAVATTGAVSSPAGAATTNIGLGTATPFAVLAGSGITNTGPTTITGDVGTFPTPAMTGFDSVVLIGTNHGGDAVTQGAKTALDTAYDQAFASAPATEVANELGGRTLTPGTYHGAELEITGALTLDTQGDPNAVFVFQSDRDLLTAASSSVVVLGGGTACNVYWQVARSATFGAGSTFVGSALVHTSISAGVGATFQGRLLARGGAVTLQQNTITAQVCAAADEGPTTTTTSTPPSTSTPAASTVTTAPAAASATVDTTPTSTALPAAGGGSASAPPTTTGATTSGATRPPAGGSATGTGRPELATTGPSEILPLLGALAVTVGLLLLRTSRPLLALRHGVPRPGRVARPLDEA